MADFTLYLLREDIKNADEAIEGDPKEYVLKDGQTDLGTLYVRPRKSKPPTWAKLFAGLVDAGSLGKVQSTGAAYFVQAAGRIFVLCFGQGRFLLKPGSTEERFGLLVVLNAVRPTDLRSVEKQSFDTVDQNSRVQTSQKSAPAEFGIDIEKDLVRGITGNPSDSTLGRRLTGAEALSVAVDTTLLTLKPLLARYLQLFQSTKYQKYFPWIDNIKHVLKKHPLHSELDYLLVATLKKAKANGGRIPGCWLAVPEVVDWTKVCRFRYGMGVTTASHSDINLREFFASLGPKDALTIELLKQRVVCAVDDSAALLEKWSVYKCIHCELDKDGTSYILSGGHWFSVENDFVSEVNSYFNDSIPRYPGALLGFKHATEEAYNVALCATAPDALALMDRKLILVGGLHNQVEFCDVYSKDRYLIHVKKYGGSSLLGHLFNQGLVSGELLREDKDFVGKVNQKLPAAFHLDDPSVLPRPIDSYSIVFAIISEAKGDLTIPFFARVALRHAHKRLVAMSFKSVMLAKIQVDDAFSKKLVLPPKPLKKGKKKKPT